MCSKCQNSGIIREAGFKPCPECLGNNRECKRCVGTGIIPYLISRICEHCR